MLILALAFFYFYSGGGPNQGSRFNLDRAILEQHQLITDSYHNNSEDKAFYRGHYYCDKAPGTSFAALPALVVARAALRASGIDPNTAPGVAAQIRVATWTAAGIPALVMCLVLFTLALRKGYSPGTAVCVALAAGLASPLWAYATLFWGNALAALCLVFGTYCVDSLIHLSPSRSGARLALLGGFACGGAVVTEYPSAPIAAVLGITLLLKLRPWRSFLRRLSAFGVGALLAASILATYNWAAYGSPFHLGYASVQGFGGMKQGLFGVTSPSALAIEGVIWGPRGMLVTGPLLLLGFVGHVIAIVRRQHRTLAVLCLIFSIYPILLNVSYAYWDGGWTYGPRHMSNAWPFLAFGLAPLYRVLPKPLRGLAVVALAAACFMTMIAVSVHGMTSYSPQHPLVDLHWRSFMLGRFARHQGWVETGGPATNLGLAFGVPNSLSVIPFLVAVAVAVTGLLRSMRHGFVGPRAG
jgi:hypothetical protein